MRHARAALAEAERAADPATAGKAHYVLSREGCWSGELAVEPSTAGRRWSGSSEPASAGGSRSPTRGGGSTSSSRGTSRPRSARRRGPGRSGGPRRRAAGELRRLPERLVPDDTRRLGGASATARGASSSHLILLSADRLARCILGFAYREKGDHALAIEHIGRAIEEQTGPSATAATPGCWRHGSARPTCPSDASRRRPATRAWRSRPASGWAPA